MLFVELDLHSVVEFYLGAACISFDLYDLVVGIVVGDVLGDRCRDDSGRNGAVLAIDVGPLALAVELDLVAVFERDFIAFPKIGFFFYEGENETYIEASVENSSSILYDKEIRNKPRTRRTKRNV